jgi:hypothetical protein
VTLFERTTRLALRRTLTLTVAVLAVLLANAAQAGAQGRVLREALR